jgi:hypothetical protein
VFGNPEKEFIPTMIMNGENIATIAPVVFQEAGVTTPHRLVGATWGPSGVRAVMLPAYRDVANTAHPGW